MNKYTIQVKGNIPTIITESKIYKREYNDFKYGYGFIEFTGTDKQLNTLLDHLAEQGDSDFKVIGACKSVGVAIQTKSSSFSSIIFSQLS